jgi:hypothetical protein
VTGGRHPSAFFRAVRFVADRGHTRPATHRPHPSYGGTRMFPQPKKFGRYIVLAVIVVFIFKDPSGAAHLAHQGAGLVTQFATAAGQFVSSF